MRRQALPRAMAAGVAFGAVRRRRPRAGAEAPAIPRSRPSAGCSRCARPTKAFGTSRRIGAPRRQGCDAPMAAASCMMPNGISPAAGA